MAAVTLLGSATFNTSSGTKTVTATPAANDLILVITAHTGNTSSALPTDDNGDGGTYSLVTTAQKASSADTMRLYVRNKRIGNAQSTVFTHAPGTSSGGGLAVLKVTGMARVGPAAIRQSAVQQNQAAATPAPAFGTAALTGNACVGACFNATNPAGLTVRTGWAAEDVDTGYATPTTGLHVMHRDSGETGTTQTWGSASASAFSSLVAELDTTSLPVDPDGDSYWSGVANCFVGVAIAAAAAVSATAVVAQQSYWHNDASEHWVPPQYSGGVLKDPARVITWPVDDALPQQAAPSLAVDPADWLPPQPALLPAQPLLLWDDQQIVPQPAATFVDDGYWWQPPWVVNTTIAPMVLAIDGDAAPRVTVFEADPWQPPPAVPNPLQLQPWGHDEFKPAAASAAPPDDGTELPPLTPMAQAVQVVVWATDEEIVPQPVLGAAGGGVLKDCATILRWPQIDDLPPQAAPAAALDDSAWQPPVPPRPDAQPLLAWPQADELPRVTVFEPDEWPAPLARAWAPPLAEPAISSDEAITQASPPLPVDEAYWLRLEVPQVPANTWLPVDDPVIVAQPPAHEDYWQQPYSVRVEPMLWVGTQQDDFVPPPLPLHVDECYDSLPALRAYVEPLRTLDGLLHGFGEQGYSDGSVVYTFSKFVHRVGRTSVQDAAERVGRGIAKDSPEQVGRAIAKGSSGGKVG